MRQPKERPRGELVEGTLSQDDEIQWLKSQLQEMQMEIDILKETVKVLKKDPGVDTTVLKNAEKAAIVDALKDRYSLPLLLSRLALAKSSYYYQKSIARRGDKYAQIRSSIITLFHDSKIRQQVEGMEQVEQNHSEADARMEEIQALVARSVNEPPEYDDLLVRKAVGAIRVKSAEKLEITFRDGRTVKAIMGKEKHCLDTPLFNRVK